MIMVNAKCKQRIKILLNLKLALGQVRMILQYQKIKLMQTGLGWD